MSREADLKRLKKSLYETQDILNDLIRETSVELEKKWDMSREDASKRLMEAGKRFEKNYDEARSKLDSTIKGTSKDLEKRYAQSSKEAEKLYKKTRHEAEDRYKDLSEEARKKLEEAKLKANTQTEELKMKAANLLQGLAAGVLTMRNKLEPKKRLALRDEKEKHHLGKSGYFKRIIAIALIIVAKKDRILSLGQQLYHKLQDKDARDAVKGEARDQFDTMRRLMKAYANGEYREFPYMSIVKIVAAVVYFVSVVDLIPDFIPILGLTDDLAILAWVYASVKDDLQNFVDWEAANERRREKMESHKASETAGSTAGAKSGSPTATPAPDREASPNTGTANRSTTPTPSANTSAVGGSSSVVNQKMAEANNNINRASSSSASTNTGSSGSQSTENKNSGSSSGNAGGGSNTGNSNQKGSGNSSSGGGSSK